MRIDDILKGVKFRSDDDAGSVDVPGISDDSRKVMPGWLFVAKKGCADDGSKFIADAVRRGAYAVVAAPGVRVPEGARGIYVNDPGSALPRLSANFYGHPCDKMKVIGVTGTNGKTTVTYILESIIRSAGGDAGVIGTINYRFKGKEFPARNTTPGPLELQSMMASMVKCGVGYAVMEVSSHSLDQGRVDDILFDAAVFTNVTGDHLDYHRTMSNYFNAKKRLFAKLKKGGVAVLNRSDRRISSFAGTLKRSGVKVLTYGAGADVGAKDIKLSMNGTSFDIVFKKRRFRARTRLIGMHNVSNILAAFVVSVSLGISEKAVLKGIEETKDVPGRLEAVEEGQPFKVFVDFAHTEDAILNVLGLLRGVARRRIVTVFGCGGERDRTKRPRMGRAACSMSDRVIITSDNPRREDPMEIIGEVEAGIKGAFSNYDIIADRRMAIEKALGYASRGDIVILAGKGHETYQMIKDEALPFDDREVAREILKKRGAL